MHRRMAKNDKKFTKIHFFRELSLKSGKIDFYEFWMIFGHSTVHHQKKLQKKIAQNRTLEKKNISPKKRKIADFFSAKGHKFHKNGQKFNFFVP